MKLKCRPEDFRVEEITAFACTGDSGGPFAVYRLVKQSIGTPEAIDTIAQRWALRRDRISFGGMKDRHAATTQTLTIHNGPKRGLKQTNLDLAYLGQAPRAFVPADISANRFTIVMRDMSAAAIERATAALNEVAAHGIPNYFDDQRFGSVGESGDFIAQAWCLGDFSRALWLAIADPNDHDRPDDKPRKKTLRDHWGNWAVIKEKIGATYLDRIIARLIDQPDDYRFAFALIPAHIRDLYLAAYQSFLWNRMLSLLIRDRVPAAQIATVELDHDTLAFPRSLPPAMKDELQHLMLPLPSARARFDDEPSKALCERVLKDVGIELRQLKTKPPRDVYFSRGNRPAFIFPQGINSSDAEDEMHAGRRKLTLAFDLPRGCYATILVKRITTVAAEGQLISP
jgi:tRNA pseudouridine13 synthase